MSKKDVPATSAEPNQIGTKRELGKFVKGVSGNPAGRPKGSKNRATLISNAIGEYLQRNMVERVDPLLNKAYQLAMEGDQQMLKMLLGPYLKHIGESEDEQSSGAVTIRIENLTVSNNQGGTPPGDVIEASFSPVDQED